MVKLVEHQESLRRELVQSMLAYVGVASFLTYRDADGFVRYAVWFEDRHLGYVLGLHAAAPGLGGVEIRPSVMPSVLGECRTAWEMEMAGYGGAPLPPDTGKRSATAALGAQITDAAYRLLVCRRVDSSPVMDEWERSGGRPRSIYGRVAGIAAREAAGFLEAGSSKRTGRRRAGAKPAAEVKPPPYTHARIILGGTEDDHLAILRDSFPAGSLRRRRILQPGEAAALAVVPPKVTHSNRVHFPVFNDAELAALRIIPDEVAVVPMTYGRAAATVTQPPEAPADLMCPGDDSVKPEPEAPFLRVDAAPDHTGARDAGRTRDAPKPRFPVRITSGAAPRFPIRIMSDIDPPSDWRH